MKEWYTTAELAGLPGMPNRQNTLARAKREGWQSRPREAIGGGKEYHLTSLPMETRKYLTLREIEQAQHDNPVEARAAENTALAISDAIENQVAVQTRETGLKRFAVLPKTARTRADARIYVLRALNDYQQRGGDLYAFCVQYNDRTLAVEPWVLSQAHRLSPSTLHRWKARILSEGLAGLGGHYGKLKGRSKIETQPELKLTLLAALTQHPHASSSHLLKILRARFEGTQAILPSKRRLEIWLAGWKAENAELHTAVTSPDAWKNRYMSALGDASADVTRLNQRWEMDSTPADILLADGRYHVLGVIDVYSRRGMLLVSRTSKATAVGLLLRRAILEWGVPEQVKTDNGSDYVSNYFARVLMDIGIEHLTCQPFSAWEKPHIERFLQTFSHGVVELLPGYIGHNVAERSAIESRRSFADRLFKKDEAIEMRLDATQFQNFCDTWSVKLYATHAHDGLANQTPAERAAAWTSELNIVTNPRALDIVLAESPDTGLRVVTKKGLRVDNGEYIAPELALHVGKSVRVAWGETLGELYVFSDDGDYICTAVDGARLGEKRREIAAKGRALQRVHIQTQRKELKQLARDYGMQYVAADILAHAASKNTEAPVAPQGNDYTTPALEAAAQVIAKPTPAALPAQTQNDIDAYFAADESRAKAEPDTSKMNDAELYQHWCALEKCIAAGETFSGDAMQFFDSFRQSPTWRVFHDMYETLKL